MASLPTTVPLGLRVGAVVVALVAIGLGVWQVGRDGERNAGRAAAQLVAGLPALGHADPVDAASGWREVAWHGHFDGAVHLEASRSDGLDHGYGAFQRFRRDDGRTVLVDRGWVPAEGIAEWAHREALDQTARVLTGQLRPLGGAPDATPFEGHGTRIWPPRSTAVLRLATGSDLDLFVTAGPPGGVRLSRDPPRDGFEVVPERDDTSAHYAAQWFAIAGLAALVAIPGAPGRIRRIVGA